MQNICFVYESKFVYRIDDSGTAIGVKMYRVVGLITADGSSTRDIDVISPYFESPVKAIQYITKDENKC